jgi:hypothetical protein
MMLGGLVWTHAVGLFHPPTTESTPTDGHFGLFVVVEDLPLCVCVCVWIGPGHCPCSNSPNVSTRALGVVAHGTFGRNGSESHQIGSFRIVGVARTGRLRQCDIVWHRLVLIQLENHSQISGLIIISSVSSISISILLLILVINTIIIIID